MKLLIVNLVLELLALGAWQGIRADPLLLEHFVYLVFFVGHGYLPVSLQT